MTKKRKITKPASEAQKLARERNWNKGQIACMISSAKRLHQCKTTQLSERLELSNMIFKLNKILDNWKK